MKIRMKVTVSGLRDGEPWPSRGTVVDVPDDEGAALCAAGLAEPVSDRGKEKVETATPPDDSEQREQAEPEPKRTEPVTTDSAPAAAKKTSAPRKAPAKKAASADSQDDSK